MRVLSSSIITVLTVFAISSPVQALRLGDTICTAGYVMDKNTVDAGTLPDRPDIITLEGPNLHSVSSLIENAQSGLYILQDPAPGEAQYGKGWFVRDEEALIELAISTGTSRGLRAKTTGTIVSFSPQIIDVTEVQEHDSGSPGCPTADSSNVSPGARPTEAPSASPTEEPTMAATELEAGPSPSDSPTDEPSATPIIAPTAAESTSKPQTEPPESPSDTEPEPEITIAPASETPSAAPTAEPSVAPTPAPTAEPSVAPTPAPTAEPSVAPTPVSSAEPTEEPTLAPSEVPSLAPTAAPSFAPTIILETPYSGMNCSEYQDIFQVPNLPVTVEYVVDLDYDGNGTSVFAAQVVYEGEGWVGFGISSTGGMIGSTAVIGLPSMEEDGLTANPGKYQLAARHPDLVSLHENQTLIDASIQQNETHTVLSFVKLLEEDGDVVIDPFGNNTFLVAYGYFNDLAYHEGRASFILSLSPCSSTNMTNMTNFTTMAPTEWDGVLTVTGDVDADADADEDEDGSLETPDDFIATGRLSGNKNTEEETSSAASFARLSVLTILSAGLALLI